MLPRIIIAKTIESAKAKASEWFDKINLRRSFKTSPEDDFIDLSEYDDNNMKLQKG